MFERLGQLGVEESQIGPRGAWRLKLVDCIRYRFEFILRVPARVKAESIFEVTRNVKTEPIDPQLSVSEA